MASRFIMPTADVGKGITPSDGAQLFFFSTGTSSPKDTFTTEAPTIANANPVIADANGVFPDIWITGSYKVQLKNKNNVQTGFGEADPVSETVTVGDSNNDLRYAPKVATVAAMVAASPVTLDGIVFIPVVGMVIEIVDYATGNDSGLLIGSVVAAASGTPDGGSFIDLANGLQWRQNFNLGGAAAKQFGCVVDGVADDTLPWAALLDYLNAQGGGEARIGVGTLRLLIGATWTALTNITIVGEGYDASNIHWDTGNLEIRSPVNIRIKDVTLSTTPSDSLFNDIHVSNYTGVYFKRCKFEGFGGLTANKAGSSCMFLYAHNTAGTHTSAGASTNAQVIDCHFLGAARFTNFGVRVFTEFGGGTVENSDTKIRGCTFDGFNWNAVEIAGPNTTGVILTQCTANLCGLTPFEIDKGAHDCIVDDVVINRLLGNIDTIANPNTRAAVATIQGVDAATSAFYARNNRVTNVVAHLLAADIAAYGRTMAAASMTYAEDSHISGVQVTLDSVPAQPPGAGFGFAMAVHAVINNCSITDIQTVNASAGVFQTEVVNTALIATSPNRISSFSNDGLMNGEMISHQLGTSGNGRTQFIYKDIHMRTDLASPQLTTGLFDYGIVAIASGSSAHFIMIENSVFEIPNVATAYFMLDQIDKVGLKNVVINGIPVTERFIHSESNTDPAILGLDRVTANFGQTPINLSAILEFLDQTCAISGGINELGLPTTNPTTLTATAAPTFPPASLWDGSVNVQRSTRTAGSFEGWISIGGVFKTYGVTSA